MILTQCNATFGGLAVDQEGNGNALDFPEEILRISVNTAFTSEINGTFSDQHGSVPIAIGSDNGSKGTLFLNGFAATADSDRNVIIDVLDTGINPILTFRLAFAI